MKRPSMLPEGVRFVGEVDGEGDFVVFGTIEGPVNIDGAVVIEESGMVKGHVRGRSVTVRGALKGHAFGEDAVVVDASARVVGDLTAPRVRVVPGARFRGKLLVRSVADPSLGVYDPTMHTFTGVPAPVVTTPFDSRSSADEPQFRTTLSGFRAPSRPPSRPPLTSKSSPPLSSKSAPPLSSKSAPPLARKPALVDEPPTEEVMLDEPTDEQPRFSLKMPTLGRSDARRRGQ